MQWRYLGVMLRTDLFPELPAPARPEVATLLEVDAEFRGSHRSALRCSRAGWHFRAAYSGTDRAKRLGRDHDWVVIGFHDSGGRNGFATVVTETRGALAGERVVRGREAECYSAAI